MGISDFRVASQDLADGDLELEAREGESIEVVARGVEGGGENHDVEEYIREELMLAYPVDEADGELMPIEHVERMHTDLLRHMRDEGLRAPSLKVPEGQTFTLSNPDGAGRATAIYKELDASGVSSSSPGGPGTKSRTFISSGTTTENVASGGAATAVVETSTNPPQLPDFPFEEDVSTGYEYDLQALALVVAGTAGGDTSIDGFKLTSDETDFLARDSAFVDPSLARFPSADMTVLPMMFPSTPTFTPGEELELTLDVSNGGGGAQDAIVDATYVFYRRSV